MTEVQLENRKLRLEAGGIMIETGVLAMTEKGEVQPGAVGVILLRTGALAAIERGEVQPGTGGKILLRTGGLKVIIEIGLKIREVEITCQRVEGCTVKFIANLLLKIHHQKKIGANLLLKSHYQQLL